MKLSVVMAVRDGERFVREAIESVLAQSVADFEFLIVDDASVDATFGVLSTYQHRDRRIRVLRNERTLGPYPSVNRALAHARGDVIARHDADDISPPDRFAIQTEALESSQDISLVTGVVEIFGNHRQPDKLLRPPTWQPRLEWELLFGNVIGAGAHVMFPRVFQGAPLLYSTRRAYAEDYALWCRLSRIGRVVCPAQVVYRYRRHASSITSRRKAEQDECVSAIRHEYQAQYLQVEAPRDVLAELTRFWTANGARPLDVSVNAISAVLAEIRSNFLADIERRYGLPDRARLEAELDDLVSDRLGYWLYRSAKALRAKTCQELVAIARARGEAVGASTKALGHVAAALLRKLSWSR